MAAGASAAVSIWTPIVNPRIAERWFSWPNLVYLAPIPALSAVLFYLVWRALHRASELLPFIGAAGIFVLSYIGIAISLWPFVVPYHFTLWQAASAPSTQAFLAIGTMFLLPVILIYTAWSYWVFRGKVKAEVGYH
jgi:cytochrome d ubiquinol oxidase subunit II